MASKQLGIKDYIYMNFSSETLSGGCSNRCHHCHQFTNVMKMRPTKWHATGYTRSHYGPVFLCMCMCVSYSIFALALFLLCCEIFLQFNSISLTGKLCDVIAKIRE